MFLGSLISLPMSYRKFTRQGSQWHALCLPKQMSEAGNIYVGLIFATVLPIFCDILWYQTYIGC